jgi:hypothetical protein
MVRRHPRLKGAESSVTSCPQFWLRWCRWHREAGCALDDVNLNRSQTVEASRPDDGAPLGVPEAMRERLFEPFVAGRPEGTGLGPAIVNQIARANWRQGPAPT